MTSTGRDPRCTRFAGRFTRRASAALAGAVLVGLAAGAAGQPAAGADAAARRPAGARPAAPGTPRGTAGPLSRATLPDALAGTAAGLPPAVRDALRTAQVPPEALAAMVVRVDASPSAAPRLQWNADLPVNPASVFKLVTTFAALDQFGPAWAWSTPVWATGALDANGVLHGSVAIEGRGDPKLVVERVWLLLRRLQQAGVREIRGDLLLDHGAFAPTGIDPAAFDAEPHRPQNVQPDALLLNQHTVVYTFTPDAERPIARVGVEPPLDGVQVDATVPLADGPCTDWRSALAPVLNEPGRVRFAGSFPAACGERAWPLASAEPQRYGERLVARLWRELGGRLGGQVRSGRVPAQARLLFEQPSPPLADAVRDINKFSNNVMAEQVFLSLALPAAALGTAPTPGVPWSPSPTTSAATDGNAPATATAPTTAPATAPTNASANASAHATPALGDDRSRPAAARPLPARRADPASAGHAEETPTSPHMAQGPAPATAEAARLQLRAWIDRRVRPADGPALVIDNGSGLSRETRLNARWLAALLQQAWASPVMPEFVSSLPVTGADGTLRRSVAVPGRAHLKTGTLRDVAALAGYVTAANGQRWVVVAVINHPRALQARPALDALVQWAGEPTPP